ncbi:MAG: trehalose-phosphatase [Candidatus Sumerlaeia bacterium]|nr:trehalose-phosphatase [Candidatus Sumerlaeia bacterium]
MKQLTPEGDPDRFFQRVGHANARILFLDYDGTLAPFRENRDEAFPAPGVREILTEIHHETDTRMVFVSGRSIDDLVVLLGLDFTPEIWGSHGRERLLPDGTREWPPVNEATRDAFLKAEEWAAEMGWGTCFEKKGGCVAMHWRPFPPEQREQVRDEATSRFQEIAGEHDLDVHHFDGGVEIQTPGIDKGLAISRVLEQYTEGEVAAAFLGDDMTDEDGFRTLKSRGLSVLVREEFRPTEAELWLQSTRELLEFLDRWKLNCPVPEGEKVNE